MLTTLLIKFYNQKKYHYLVLCFAVFISQKSIATVYYVNDVSTNNDLYTTVIGNDKNNGLSPSSPKLTIMAAYQEAKEGDLIYVDTGFYDDISKTGELLFENNKKIEFIIAGITKKIISRNPLPPNEKNAPDIFYIVDDKPVTRETYMKRVQETNQDKKKR